MTIYHTFIDDTVGVGASVVSGIQTTSGYGVGVSSDIVCNNLYVVGLSTFANANVYYTETISTIGITTISVNDYESALFTINYPSGNHIVNIADLVNDSKFQIFVRNIGGGTETIRFQWSSTDTGFVDAVIHASTSTALSLGRVSVASNSGGLVTLYNFGGTVYGSYGG